VPGDHDFRIVEKSERHEALETLTDAVRRLLEATVGTGQDAEAIRAAAVEVDGIADRLGEVLDEDPWVERFYGPGIVDAPSMMAINPAMGRANPVAPIFDSRVGEDGSVAGTVHFGLRHVGPPYRVHGGMVAAVLDQVLGVAAIAGGSPGYTGSMTVRYRRATPLREDVRFAARLVGGKGRISHATGELYDSEGRVTAEAEATFVQARGENQR
jgi:acyl-coenzyme A thioesterase PaaI-like protein